MLEMTRTLVTEKFSVLNGYPADAHVLYGGKYWFLTNFF